MRKHGKGNHFFFGTTTMGEKGQVVVPAKARKAMELKKGEKLLVFGTGHDMLAFTKLSHIEEFAAHLSKRLGAIRSIVRKTRSK
ncbi:MAG: hypothetical protein COU47_03385 [Candidatus Niyogibacteria bacterium CG10_big_fil_rev_8_21_14_0_10_46_36]|uniref:SpoVT-AbrB domain-containing protein n=1 Tax=Candidatus Niyogibacteria bacterium CG10_big_fil_rev_8_21_14_0_10_46_36 TaxID=1974726 RepID=A0A2H0TD03_9BACT|nr:MAG: hypothetical protein COU47_03385 [Candidatus Niyogibacteria bacterium CG10_big_fil_rev_8_21_14_0_10_46_36]